MAREFARPFYDSAKWEKCRTAYMSQVNWICERCGNPAALVHHKKYINESNIHDPAITLNFDNLEALCQECHNDEHVKAWRKPVDTVFDDEGNVVYAPRVFLISGAPGSGKSTYVRNNKKFGDLVLDLDFIGAALIGEPENIHKSYDNLLSIVLAVRETIYNAIANNKGNWKRAFVITTQANVLELNSIAQRLKAEIIIMNTSKEECLRRIKNDFSRKHRQNLFERLVIEWFNTYDTSRMAESAIKINNIPPTYVLQ